MTSRLEKKLNDFLHVSSANSKENLKDFAEFDNPSTR